MKKLIAFLLCLALASSSCICLAEETQEYASYTLLDTNQLPPELGERKLTDEQINGLQNAPLDRLRKEISTFPDYVAWVDTIQASYVTSITSNPEFQITLDPEFCYQWLNSMIGTNGLVSFAQYILEDDYPGMGVAMAVLVSSEGHDWIYANTFPTEKGYLVLGAASYSKNIQSKTSWGMNVIEPLVTSDLTGIISFCKSNDLKWGRGKTLSQVLLFDSTEGVVMNWHKPVYVPIDATHITELFTDSEAMYPTEPLSFKPYKFPKQIGTESDLDSATARALSKGTVQELAEVIHSVPDLMTYMHYAAFSKYDGDLTVPLKDLEWHYNYSPDVVFRKNAGNCGGTAGFVEYVLQGDYDEVGIIGLTYDKGLGGGHVINYIRQGKNYFVMDFNSWICNGCEPNGLRFCTGKDLKAAAKEYTKTTGGIVLMVGYQSGWGDAPVGWDGSEVSYLINGYSENVQILMEDSPDSYHYEFVDASDDLKQLFKLSSNVW